MDLSAVEAFVRAAEARSFTAAARKIGMTASGVSKAVTRLEAQVGAMLLHRTTRAVSLTADGTLFFERCKQILSDLKEAEGLLAKTALAPAGRLRVTMPVALGRAVVMPALAEMSAQYPDLMVEASLTDATLDLVHEGYDAALRIGELPPCGLVARAIGETRWIACAAPEYLERKGVPATPDDLQTHDCVAYVAGKTGRGLDWQFARGGQSWTFRCEDVCHISVDHCDALLDVALAGGGIICVHDYVALRYLADGKLVQVLEEFETPTRRIHVVYPPLRQLSPKVRAFVEMAIKALPLAAPGLLYLEAAPARALTAR